MQCNGNYIEINYHLNALLLSSSPGYINTFGTYKCKDEHRKCQKLKESENHRQLAPGIRKNVEGTEIKAIAAHKRGLKTRNYDTINHSKLGFLHVLYRMKYHLLHHSHIFTQEWVKIKLETTHTSNFLWRAHLDECWTLGYDHM